MRLMYDSDNETYPADVQYIAAYVDGSRTGRNYERARAAHPNATICKISAVGSADGNVIDIEPGNVWPPENAVDWTIRQRARGGNPGYYCNTSTRPAVLAAYAARGVDPGWWWRADYQERFRHEPPINLPLGEAAWQYANPPITGHHWDVSVIADDFPGFDDDDGSYVAPEAPQSAGGGAVGGTYVVQPGDTLSGIGERLGISWQSIYDANRGIIGSNPNVIKAGQVLSISGGSAPAVPSPAPPGGRTVTVQPGDTLSGIASQLGIDWRDLYSANAGLIGPNPDLIMAGQVLSVPGGSSPAPAPAPVSGRRHIDTVTVQPGDSLTAIARRYPQQDVTIDSIARDNGVVDKDHIEAGWQLAIYSEQ